MISLRPKKDGGGYEIVDYETAPIPPSVTTTAKSTGNYGLANDARRAFQELALKEGEVPRPVVSNQVKRDPILKGKTQEIRLSIGRGRGRVLHVPQMEPGFQTVSKEAFKEVAEEEGAVGLDGGAAAGGMKAPEVKEEYPLSKLPPRYYESADKASYEKVAELFLQGLQGTPLAEKDIFEDFEGDSFAPPKGSNLVFEDTAEEEEAKDQQLVIEANERKKDGTGLAEVQQAPNDGVEGSIYTDSELDYAAPCGSTSAARVVTTTDTFRPAGRPTIKPGKTNGYCLFIKYRASQTGTKGSINELMRAFDDDWKVLPEQEKQEWKRRAKVGGTWKPSFQRGSDRGGGFSRPSSSRTSSVSSSNAPKSSSYRSSDTRSVTSETSTTTDTTTVSHQAEVDDDDWF